ncbi:unnamed protein product [Boreogadus saida]
MHIEKLVKEISTSTVTPPVFLNPLSNRELFPPHTRLSELSVGDLRSPRPNARVRSCQVKKGSPSVRSSWPT